MARNRGEGKAAKEGGRVSIVHLLGNQRERTWLDEVHRATDIPRTTIVRRALSEWAVARGGLPPYPVPGAGG